MRSWGYRAAVAALVLSGAAAAIGVISLWHGDGAGVSSDATVSTSSTGGSQSPGGSMGPGPEVTLARPLGGFVGSQMSLANASSALGAALTLPDSPTVRASDAGPVWAASGRDGNVSVAVTFPKQGLIVLYERPAMSDPLSNFQSFVKDSPGSQVAYLSASVPALSIPELPDGSNWGSVEFVSGGTIIAVLGHNDEATLEGVANSILDRSTASG
jgi:hypothetical protein